MSKDNPQLEDGYTRINNDILSALFSYKLSGTELRIILFVIRHTYGYGKITKHMTAAYIAEGAEIPFYTVNKIIPQLKAKNILIEILHNGKIEIGINKQCQKWQCQKRHYSAENGIQTVPKTALSQCQKRHTDSAENGIQINKPFKENIKENIKESGQPTPERGEASAKELPPVAVELGFKTWEEWEAFRNQ